jgi:hypothetical protein
MAKEIVNCANDLPVSRQELLEFIEVKKSENPGLEFDLSLMSCAEEHENTWFIR